MADWQAAARDLGWAAGTWASRPLTVDVGAVLLAQTASGDPLAQYTGYGALGLVVFGAIIGQIRFKAEVVALQKAWDEDRARWGPQGGPPAAAGRRACRDVQGPGVAGAARFGRGVEGIG